MLLLIVNYFKLDHFLFFLCRGKLNLESSVGDPDPASQDISMFLGLLDPDPLEVLIRLRILPFSHKGVERTEIMLANKILTQNFRKNKIFKTEDNVPTGTPKL